MDEVRDPKNGGKRVQGPGSRGAASPPAGKEGRGQDDLLLVLAGARLWPFIHFLPGPKAPVLFSALCRK